ncbi:MAG: hypothetical protein ACYTG2_09650 [Planctomycetota bacterium]|jgi:hypothetical protein
MNHLKELAGEVLSPERVLHSFALSEEVAAMISPRLDELVRSIPRLRPWRGFSEGAWVIGARTTADTRRTTRADYSRVEFEIRLDADERTARLACRRTHRGRDERTERLAVMLDEPGRKRLVEWLEGMLLGFASCYFERSV